MSLSNNMKQTPVMPPEDLDGTKPPYVTVRIQREALTQEQLDEKLQRVAEIQTPLTERVRHMCTQSKSTCIKDTLVKTVVSGFPLLKSLRSYNPRKQLVGDIIAGISVAVVHIPQGLGFAILTGVPPVYGLYASFWPALVYTFMGTGFHVSIGTMALISLMINSVVQKQVIKFKPPNIPPNILLYNTTYVDSNRTLPNMGNIDHDIKSITNSTINITTFVTGNATFLNTTETPHDLTLGLTALDKYKIDLVCSVTLMIGIMQIGLGVLRLGIISALMSKPFVGGFTTGAAFQIVTSQMNFVMGVTLPPLSGIFVLPKMWFYLLKSIPETNLITFTTGVICAILLILIKTQINTRFKDSLIAPVPAELIVVIMGCFLSYFAKFPQNYNVQVVDSIPLGLPAPLLPSMSDGQTYIIDAFIIALASFTLTFSMGTLLGSKHGYSVVANQEMFVLGMAHSLTAFFSGFAGSAAPPRCLVLEATGATTQLAGLVSSLLLLLVILFIGPLFEPLPITILAAIIIVAVLPLFLQFKSLPLLWRVNKNDFAIWVITCAAVVILNVGMGLGVGLISSVCVILRRGLFTKGHLLGSDKEENVFLPLAAYQNIGINGVVSIFRFEGDLYFLSKERFTSEIHKIFFQEFKGHHNLMGKDSSNAGSYKSPPFDNSLGDLYEGLKQEEREQSTKLDKHTNLNMTPDECAVLFNHVDHEYQQGMTEEAKQEESQKFNPLSVKDHTLQRDKTTNHQVLILDMSCVTYIDMMGIEALKSVQSDLESHRINTVLACVSCTVLTTIKRAGETWTNGDKMEIYPTLHDAYALVSAQLSYE